MKTLDKLQQLAQELDRQNKPDVVIRSYSRREYLMKLGLKPSKRGEDLYIGQHQIICGHGKDERTAAN